MVYAIIIIVAYIIIKKIIKKKGAFFITKKIIKKRKLKKIEVKRKEIEAQREAELAIEKERKRVEEEARRKEAAAEAAEYAKKRAEAEAAFVNILASLPMPTIVPSTPAVTADVNDKLNNIKYSSITVKTNRTKLSNFVVIDTETTGLSAARNEIIDIAAIRFRDWQPVEKFSCLLSPRKPIPAEATEVNGITNEMVAGKPHFNEVAAQLVDFIGKDNIVGQNLPFDISFIMRSGADVTNTNRKYYDTLDIAKHTLKKVKNKWDKDLYCYMPDTDSDYDVDDYKLETLCSYYGIVLVDAHRAENDALATGVLFNELANTRQGI